jgi:hypothetical protein
MSVVWADCKNNFIRLINGHEGHLINQNGNRKHLVDVIPGYVSFKMRKVREIIKWSWWGKKIQLVSENDQFSVCRVASAFAVPAVIFPWVHYSVYLNPILSMSSNSETKSRKSVHSEGCDIIISKVIQFFDQENPSGNFIFPTENATKRAAAATGK